MTDWLVELIEGFVSHWRDSPWAELDRAVSMTRPGGIADVKKGQARVVGCPTACDLTVTLCGFCVSDQAPGNIALGAAYGPKTARTIGVTAAGVSFGIEGESYEDFVHYDIGGIIRNRVLKDSVERRRDHLKEVAKSERVKKARAEMCFAVKVAVSTPQQSGLMFMGSMPCDPCGHAFRRKHPRWVG